MGDLCLIGCLIPVLPAGGDDLVGHQLDLLLVARVVWHALQVERVLQACASVLQAFVTFFDLKAPLSRFIDLSQFCTDTTKIIPVHVSFKPACREQKLDG